MKFKKYAENYEPEKDLKVIEEAFENINKINPKKLEVAIVTVSNFRKESL